MLMRQNVELVFLGFNDRAASIHPAMRTYLVGWLRLVALRTF
jgi:hypothetical protein